MGQIDIIVIAKGRNMRRTFENNFDSMCIERIRGVKRNKMGEKEKKE